jgi:hypothetical protein
MLVNQTGKLLSTEIMSHTRSIKAKRPPLSTRRLADKVFRVSDLSTIRLNSCSASNSLDPKSSFHVVKMSIGAHSSLSEADEKLFVKASFHIQAYPEGDATHSVDIQCEFVLAYELESLRGIEEEHIEAFTKWIGINNAWPYAREFVQSTAARMDAPTLRMPLYKPEYMAFESASEQS